MTQENPDIQKPTTEELPAYAWAHHWTTQNYEKIQLKTKLPCCVDLVEGHSSCEIVSQPTLDGFVRTRCGGELHNSKVRVFKQLEPVPSVLHTYLIPLPETKRCWHFYFAICTEGAPYSLKTPSFEICLFAGPFSRRRLIFHAEANHGEWLHRTSHHADYNAQMIHAEAGHSETYETQTHYESDEFGETENTGWWRG